MNMLYSIIRFCLTVFLVMNVLTAVSQALPEHVSNRPLYDFLDELANHHIIHLAGVVKPYSRSFIAEKLSEALLQQKKLNKRQKAVLIMFLRDFSLETGEAFSSDLPLWSKKPNLLLSVLPPVALYRDSLFRFSLRPVYGLNYLRNDNGGIRHTWGGADVKAMVGRNWAVWASLRDNYQKNGLLARPEYLTLEQGGNYKVNEGGRPGGDYSEMRGGIAWSWDWGSLSLQKDHETWGDNYHGALIFSGRTPSFAKVTLNMRPAKWIDFHYFHGWLVSEVADSARSYITTNGVRRTVYRNKFIAANMFTFTPFPRLNISVGNSIVYGDMDVHPAYLIPFMFFKSIDHTLNHRIDNQNSQMFLNISTRQIKHLHAYFTWFVDEFSKTRINDKERRNFTSTKAGFRLDGWPVQNTALTTEYTFSYPLTYKHYVPTLTFETNRFNLGHYLRDNSDEIFVSIEVKPYRGVLVEASFVRARHGNEYSYTHGSGPVDRFPFLSEISWQHTAAGFRASWLFYNNISAFLGITYSNLTANDLDGKPAQYYLDKFSPSIFHGRNTNIQAGFQAGF